MQKEYGFNLSVCYPELATQDQNWDKPSQILNKPDHDRFLIYYVKYPSTKDFVTKY